MRYIPKYRVDDWMFGCNNKICYKLIFCYKTWKYYHIDIVYNGAYYKIEASSNASFLNYFQNYNTVNFNTAFEAQAFVDAYLNKFEKLQVLL